MNITKKIEEIRLQPDHIKLRWVLGSVLVSMLIILAIWIFSITLMFKGREDQSPDKFISDLKKQTNITENPSLQVFTKDQSLYIDEVLTQNQSANSSESLQSENQSSDYSNLDNLQQ